MFATARLRALSPIILSAVIAVSASAQVSATKSLYHIRKRSVIGGEGGWDYLTIDTVNKRLLITRTNRVSALDLNTGRIVAELPGLKGAHGVAIDYKLGRGFATSGDDGVVVTFDLRALREIARTPAAADADAIVFDAASNRVFSFNGDAKSASVIDPATGKKTGDIPLGGKPEFGVTNDKGRIWVNIEDKGEVAEIDAKALKVVRRWSIKPCESPTGLAIDVAHSRLFSVCGNQKMVVSDAINGKAIATLPIGAGADGAAFDPASGNAFASNYDATMTVVHEDTPDSFKVVQTINSVTGARTMTIDPTTRIIYSVSAKLGPAPSAPTKANPHMRPVISPGSVTVVVIAP